MNERKAAYALFLNEVPDAPVFMEPWYLDALAPGWDCVLYEKGGRTLAAWPFYPRHRGPLRQVTMPPLVRFMGPLLHPDCRQPDQAHKILPELWSRMPPCQVFLQHSPYSLEYWLPLHWAGFRQSTRYSYRLDTGKGREALWQGLSPSYRNQKIPKARTIVTVEESGDIEAFLAVQKASFQRQGLPPPLPDAVLRDFHRAARQAGRATLLLARNRQSGAVESGAFLVWDRHSLYHLMAGDSPEGRKHASGILLTWACVELALERGFTWFDFLGSMIPSIEAVRRQFGATPTPYFSLSWFSSRWLALLWQLRRGGR
jgi:hypothetical protein